MLTTPVTPALVRGALEVEQTPRGLLPHRLPAWARAQLPDPQLLMAESMPSGVRVAFRTAATVIELEALPSKRAYAGAPPRPDGTYELVVDGQVVGGGSIPGGDVLTVDMMTGRAESVEGEPGRVRWDGLAAGPKAVEIWLPHDESSRLVALHTDAPVEPAAPGASRVWVHHGSSISHGSAAERPTGTWPAYAARLAGVDLVNLGFAGSALVDQCVARTIRDTPADLVSLKLGINVTNHDLMRMRGFTSAVHGFLDTIRDGHPDTPLVVVSPVWCGIHEETPGPAAPDMSALAEGEVRFVALGDPAEVAAGRLTLQTIRAELARIVDQRADPHLTYVDGLSLYGAEDAVDLPLPDGLHPDSATHRLIGERFAKAVL
ncbi:lipase [Nocardioides sp. MAH-18]|uniref:Lipase n=1 Tax=Nocardioides agri TaxID=2682843 RepID=A0A6L6XXI6_9ACTN|nr:MULTISPECIES: SGNH/GDSL hydrolase family protein [unclassified Nocardioides]MBA2952646.1 lipase [Nocardioides sp. CGMCC 1.13656]MVQ51808.1 lipase [Nocardioides sp. MAH-18]